MHAIRNKLHGKHSASKKNIVTEKKIVETETVTTTQTVAPLDVVAPNELLYADGANGTHTLLDGTDPFVRDNILADNPMTHNEFAREARGNLKTAGPMLTSDPVLGGYHGNTVTPVGDGGVHINDKHTKRNAKRLPNATALPGLAAHSEDHKNRLDEYEDDIVQTEVLPSTGESSFLPPVSETFTKTTVRETVIPIIPIAPPAPAVYQPRGVSFRVARKPVVVVAPVLPAVGIVTRSAETFPVEIIEKPAIVHEKIRREEVEEIQPVVNVEKFRTEIRQITQPLLDKEIRPISISEKVLPVEVLPTIEKEFVAMPRSTEASTREYEPVMRHLIEKAPIIQETEKWRVIEEVTPVIYRETIIPHVIRTNKPIYETVVEAPIYTERLMPTRDLSGLERSRYAQYWTENYETVRAVPFVSSIPVAPPAPSVYRPSMSKRRMARRRVLETTSTLTTARTDNLPVLNTRNGPVISTNDMLYADGFNGRRTLLDGTDPFVRDHLLADNPMTHNQFAEEARVGHLTTAGPVLTSAPILGGYHGNTVTPLGDGGVHINSDLNNKYATNYRQEVQSTRAL